MIKWDFSKLTRNCFYLLNIYRCINTGADPENFSRGGPTLTYKCGSAQIWKITDFFLFPVISAILSFANSRGGPDPPDPPPRSPPEKYTNCIQTAETSWYKLYQHTKQVNECESYHRMTRTIRIRVLFQAQQRTLIKILECLKMQIEFICTCTTMLFLFICLFFFVGYYINPNYLLTTCVTFCVVWWKCVVIAPFCFTM